jgi:hypothetical protein
MNWFSLFVVFVGTQNPVAFTNDNAACKYAIEHNAQKVLGAESMQIEIAITCSGNACPTPEDHGRPLVKVECAKTRREIVDYYAVPTGWTK